jgi:metallo-beta-lactamase family protein
MGANMKITFLGATHEVTGSCFYLEVNGKYILIDCGLEQGQDVFENQDIPVQISDIDTVLLTHAHMDHAGKLPLLYRRGFRGKIHATGATSALCKIMLQDSAHIQESEAEWKNRKRKRNGEKPIEPLYTLKDALGAISLFVSYDYEEKISIYEGIEIRFIDCGHLLGSASIEMWLTEDGITKKLVLSGDIGNINQPLINDPKYIEEADYVVMESTYGDRNHGDRPDYINEIAKIIQTTFDKGGNVLIPSFAVGRTQMLLYFLRKIKADNLVKGHGDFKVYVDSPLANEVTGVFTKNMRGYFDEEAMELVEKGINPITFSNLVTSVSVEESKSINFDKSSKVIIAASGMCEAGRIRHHLKHNLWRPESAVLFVGHQSEGTLGRMILDGVNEVKLFGETIITKASTYKLSGMSGHADRNGLIKWISSFEQKPKKVFVVHGDNTICEDFSGYLNKELGLVSIAPYSGDVFDLVKDEWVHKAEKGQKL